MDAFKFFRMPLLTAATVALGAFNVPGAAQADPSSSESVHAAVSLSGLDLNSPSGAQEAQRRLEATAVRLCHRLQNDETASHRETEAECVRDAYHSAVAQLPPSTLVARNESRVVGSRR